MTRGPEDVAGGEPEGLFARWVEQARAGGPRDVGALVSAHPRHAARLLALHHDWRLRELAEGRAGTTGAPRRPGAPVPILDLPPDEEIRPEQIEGGVIGPYALRQCLGTGGFGVVFLAEQEAPVRRRVALKVLKLGMDSRQVVARFEQERQALALMDHPNIARVLDGGVTASGRPYFVMELVRGVPITAYCDANQLTTRERLEVFLPVCQAVQHAHQKGIIHRDLKPGNVLVTLHDGRPVPKIIDFGIAKAIDRRLTEKTLFTDLHQMIGTPAYMSPEQAEMSGLDVDTRSDVYSLGVLLYELLTGTTPFSKDELREAGYAGMLRLIRETEPPRPSTRVSTLGDRLVTVASRRRTDPRRLGLLLRADLDWIVMKALEKDRTRRYESAAGLAQDLQRHLDGETVLAAPPSTAYRLAKLARKNKGLVAALAGITAALVIGLAGTAWQWRVARGQWHELVAAQDARAEEERKTQAALDDAVRQQKAAERETYAANILAAQAALDDSNLPLARERLARCPDGERAWEWRYLDARANTARQVLRGYAARLSLDGRFVLTSDYDDNAFLWDATSGRELRTLRPREEGENDVDLAFASFCGPLPEIVLGDYSGVSIHDLGSGELLHRFSRIESPDGTELSPDGQWMLVWSDSDRTAFVWNPRTGASVPLEAESCVSSAHFDREGSQVVTAHNDGSLWIWDATTGQPRVKLTGHTGDVYSARFDAGATRVVSTSDDHTVRVWSAQGGPAILVLHEGCENAFDAAFDPSGTRICTESWNSVAWFSLTGTALDVQDGPFGSRLAADGRSVLHEDEDVSLLDSRGTSAPAVLRPGPEVPPTFGTWTLSPDSTRVLTYSEGVVRLCDTRDGRPVAEILPDGFATFLTFNPDGSRFALRVSGSPSLLLFDARTGERIADLVVSASRDDRKPRSLTSFAFAEGTPRVALLLDGTRVAVLSTVDGTLEALLTQDPESVQFDLESVSFDPSGALIRGANKRYHGPVWRIEEQRPIARSTPPKLGYQRYGFASFSPSGSRFTVSCPDAGVRLLDARTQRPLATGALAELAPGTRAAYFAGSDTRLITVSDDSVSRLWDLETGEQMVQDSECDALVYAEDLRVSPSGTFAAATMRGARVRLYELASKTPTDLGWNDLPLQLLDFSPDDRFLATGGADGTVLVWLCDGEIHVAMGFPQVGPNAHADEATFSPDGTKLAVLWGSVGSLLFCNGSNHHVPLETLLEPVFSFEFLPDGSRLIGRNDENAIVGAWDAETGERWPPELPELAARLPLRTLEFSEDLTRMVVRTLDGRALLIDPEGCRTLATLWTPVPPAVHVAASADGTRLVTAAARDNRAATWSVPALENVDLGAHHAGIQAVALSADGTHAATGARDRTARVWRTSDGGGVFETPVLDGDVERLDLARDGSALLTATAGGTLGWWDLASGTSRTLDARGGAPPAWVGLAGDGSLALALRSGRIDLWSLPEGAPGEALASPGAVRLAALDPARRLLVGADDDGRAWVWDLPTRALRHPLALQAAARAAAFDRAGRHLVVGTESGSLHLLDLETGQQTALGGQNAAIVAVAFTADADRIVTAGADRSVRVWDPTRSAEVLDLGRTAEPCAALWTSADGARVVAVTTKGEIRVWDADPARVEVRPAALAELGR